MKCKPLTPAEKAWLKKAHALFKQCPPRFDFLTTGDPHLDVIDRGLADKSELYDGAAERDGIVLDTIQTKGRVHGVS